MPNDYENSKYTNKNEYHAGDGPFQFPWWAIVIAFVVWWPLGLVFIGLNAAMKNGRLGGFEQKAREATRDRTASGAKPVYNAEFHPIYDTPAQPQPKAAAPHAAPQQAQVRAAGKKLKGTALGALPNLLAALALFYLFKGLDLGCVRWVNALACTTLGVYILHQVPAFRGFLWNGLLQAEAHHGSVGYTLLAILAVFLGCAAVDALRTVLVMRPLENTRLFKALCEKGDALAAKITADD